MVRCEPLRDHSLWVWIWRVIWRRLHSNVDLNIWLIQRVCYLPMLCDLFYMRQPFLHFWVRAGKAGGFLMLFPRVILNDAVKQGLCTDVFLLATYMSVWLSLRTVHWANFKLYDFCRPVAAGFCIGVLHIVEKSRLQWVCLSTTLSSKFWR